MAVLLVEDEPVVRLTLVDFLEEAGFEVLQAGDADAALDIIGKSGHRIDVLITDLDLGPGDNGLTLAAKACQHLPELQVVYATGSPEMFRGHVFSSRERVFLKPFDAGVLVIAVAVLCQESRLRRRRQRYSSKAAAAANL
jgi:DNA-binding NtrC family response regulator